MTDPRSIALTVLQGAAQTQAAWDAGEFTQITRKEAAGQGYEGCEHDPKWYEADAQHGSFIQALTDNEGGIEVYIHPKDDEPLMFTIDIETGAIRTQH